VIFFLTPYPPPTPHPTKNINIFFFVIVHVIETQSVIYAIPFFSVWLDDHWDVRYIRQCAIDGVVGMYDGRICEERYGSYNVRMRYCHCDNQDGCNSAPTLATGLHLAPLTVTLIAALVPHLLVQRWSEVVFSASVLLSVILCFFLCNQKCQNCLSPLNSILLL
jgi:hypothetical protein